MVIDPVTAIVVAAIAVGAVIVINSNKDKKEPELNKPYFGYYSTSPTQISETKDHVSCLWETCLFGPKQTLLNISEAKLPTVIDVSSYIFDVNGLTDVAEYKLRDLFNQLRSLGALQYIKGITPIDEPDVYLQAGVELPKAITLIKKVALEFTELQDIKLAVIFAGTDRLTCIELFDWVGFNKYSAGVSVLEGQYLKLKSKLRPDQRTILVPGGSEQPGINGVSPMPFIEFAQRNNEVLAIISFIYYSPAEAPGIIGIKEGPLKDIYKLAGQILRR